MTSTVYVDLVGPPVNAAWLNDVNLMAYLKTFPDGKHALTTEAAAAPAGSSLVGFQQSGTGAVARPVQDELRETAKVTQFGCVATMASDQTALLNAAFALYAGKEIRVPTGIFRVDGSLMITSGCRVVMEKGAVFYRSSTYSAATTPVVYLLDSFSELIGGLIQTDNGSPNGCVVLGIMNYADTRNVWYWKFLNCDLQGNGVAGSIGWAIYGAGGANVNYFGTVNNITTKNFDIPVKLFENANAHNISNIHCWQAKTANIVLQGAYANNFVNMFFHGGAANGCIGISLLSKTVGAQTNSQSNSFVNWTAETGGSTDQAFFIDSGCVNNTLIGSSNVAGGYTLNNYNNTIIIGGKVVFNGEAAIATAVPFGTTWDVTPVDLLGISSNGSYLVAAEVYNTAQNNFNRTDLLLLNIRSNAFAASTVQVVSSSWTNSGINGEPTAVTYGLQFSNGATRPVLTANITSLGSIGGTTYTVKTRLMRV